VITYSETGYLFEIIKIRQLFYYFVKWFPYGDPDYLRVKATSTTTSSSNFIFKNPSETFEALTQYLVTKEVTYRHHLHNYCTPTYYEPLRPQPFFHMNCKDTSKRENYAYPSSSTPSPAAA
jgi:hypothetical protein